jgi:WD repeat-containing protein 19
MGKHTKKVISGDWNKEGLLVTGGEDKLLTVSNYNSDTVFESITTKSEPKNI